ncbi:DsbA family oxidoreductase [Clostridium sartagoforme]|uniref:DsbA family oxidoreductase n=1 Tax=Clostridium sartagoforme TaxID=84031 RepID=A0A4S2DJ07_9CLOT|nr:MULTISPECIES: DsbA family oxidoreductase [Clostridium]MBS5938564.1 DsbA family oxidoreductase [Clostridium sp.]TGY41855.1 DsbA family oxidoreductase [Clostridium sartagoforme]
MKVEIWSDIFCPFCYIGKRRFENALKSFSDKDDVEIIYRSFELNPDAPKVNNNNIHEAIAEKYGMSVEEAKANNDGIVRQAASLGLEYNFDTLILTNSLDAHRLIHFAKDFNKMEEMTEALFKAYFTDSKNISDIDILGDIAKSAGLNKEEAIKFLNSDKYKNEVREDEALSRNYGITSVPTFVFNDKFKVTGAQPEDVFLMALNKALEEDKPSLDLENNDGKNVCVDGNCGI